MLSIINKNGVKKLHLLFGFGKWRVDGVTGTGGEKRQRFSGRSVSEYEKPLSAHFLFYYHSLESLKYLNFSTKTLQHFDFFYTFAPSITKLTI